MPQKRRQGGKEKHPRPSDRGCLKPPGSQTGQPAFFFLLSQLRYLARALQLAAIWAICSRFTLSSLSEQALQRMFFMKASM